MTTRTTAYENHVLVHPRNVLHYSDLLQFGPNRGRAYYTSQVQRIIAGERLSDLQRFDPGLTSTRFEKRLTEISWHPKVPYFLGAACKQGDMIFLSGSSNDGLTFRQVFGVKGRGPGGAIFAIRFDDTNKNIFYTAGLEGNVCRWDIEHKKTVDHQFYSTNNYSIWYTSMDVSLPTRTLVAGDTKGFAYLSTLDGDHVCQAKLHSDKILHSEFNPLVPHLLVTSSLDKTVKLWDLRNLKERVPLVVLPHEKGANVARFNPVNGSRLLTSDQREEIRVYQAPFWNKTLSIEQPHRQFQHLTPIVANWHPLADIIVIGEYPVVPKGTKPPPRPIQFFEAEKGALVHELFPPKNDLVSLNHFNPTGEILASGQGRSLIFWKGRDALEELNKNKPHKKCNPHFDVGTRPPDMDSDSDFDEPKSKRGKPSTETKRSAKAKATKAKPAAAKGKAKK